MNQSPRGTKLEGRFWRKADRLGTGATSYKKPPARPTGETRGHRVVATAGPDITADVTSALAGANNGTRRHASRSEHEVFYSSCRHRCGGVLRQFIDKA